MSISWNQFKTNIEREAKSLYKAGLDVEDKVAIFSQNCPEILTTHFAAYYNRGVAVPIYATSSKSEAAYIINDAQTIVLFVGDQQQYDIAMEIVDECPSLKYVVTYNPLVEKRADDKISMTWEEFLDWGEERECFAIRPDGAHLHFRHHWLAQGCDALPLQLQRRHSGAQHAHSKPERRNRLVAEFLAL